MDYGEPSSTGYIYITTNVSMAQGTSKQVRWNGHKSKNTKKSDMKWHTWA